MTCEDISIEDILKTDCVGDSLPKIVGNFRSLQNAACQILTLLYDLSANQQQKNEETNNHVEAIVPVGMIAYYTIPTSPFGWTECDGKLLDILPNDINHPWWRLRAFLRMNEYPYGHDDNPDLNLRNPYVPDLRGRFIRSHGTDSENLDITSGEFGKKDGEPYGHMRIRSYTHGFIHSQPEEGRQIESNNYLNITHYLGNTGDFDNNVGVDMELSFGEADVYPGRDNMSPMNMALLPCIKL